MPGLVRLIGIDPGLRFTGWGVIECDGPRLVHVANGTIASTQKASLAERLVELHDGLAAVVAEYRPKEAAVELTFVNKDANATLKLGHARGIALLVPAASGIAVAEYAPNLVKKSVVGSGHADKTQIRAMVAILLPRSNARTADAADALAVAITHAHHRGAAMRAEAFRVAAR